jgi:hypothetical protein
VKVLEQLGDIIGYLSLHIVLDLELLLAELGDPVHAATDIFEIEEGA